MITRPEGQSGSLARLVSEAGGEPVMFPTIVIEPKEAAPLIQTVSKLGQIDIAVFISPNAAQYGVPIARQGRDPFPGATEILAVGPGTVTSLRRIGVANAAMPVNRFDTEGLLDLAVLRDVKGLQVVIFRGVGGRPELGDTLRERGANVVYVECYQRIRPTSGGDALVESWMSGGVDVVTITSVTALENLFELIGPAGAALLHTTTVVTAGPRISETCRARGCRGEILTALRATDEALLDEICRWQTRRSAS